MDPCDKVLPDVPNFLDCVVFRAQQKNKSGVIKGSVQFQEQFDTFLAGCDDKPPPHDPEVCVAIFHHSYGVGACQQLVSAGHCRFSCRACDASVAHKPKLSRWQNRKTSYLAPSSLSVLISSDWHVEPWYEVDVQAQVARCHNATLPNMFTCCNATASLQNCALTGVSDPPLPLITSHFDAFVSRVASPSNTSILFYPGDTQAHSMTGNLGKTNESAAMRDLMSTTLAAMMRYWSAEDIFLCPGNNDGPHNSIFSQGGELADTRAWADAVLQAGIVNDHLNLSYSFSGLQLNQTAFFSRVGYFVKQIDASNRRGFFGAKLFVVMTNTNLGGSNPFQTAALQKDLKWVWLDNE